MSLSQCCEPVTKLEEVLSEPIERSKHLKYAAGIHDVLRGCAIVQPLPDFGNTRRDDLAQKWEDRVADMTGASPQLIDVDGHVFACRHDRRADVSVEQADILLGPGKGHLDAKVGVNGCMRREDFGHFSVTEDPVQQ
jgi:hypothetical protein